LSAESTTLPAGEPVAAGPFWANICNARSQKGLGEAP